MLSLSDAQLEQLKTIATPLPPHLRGAFLRTLAAELGDRDIGDGELHQIAIKVRQHVLQPSAFTKIISGDPTFQEARKSGQAFVIVGAKP